MNTETPPIAEPDTSPPSRDPLFNKKSSVLLDAMANANRLEILTHLLTAEISVGELSRRVGLSQSALSQHLFKLRAAKLVTTRRSGQIIYYTCSSLPVLQVLALLKEFFPE